MSAAPLTRRVAVISSASGNGKTTVGTQLAGRLGVPFVVLDALAAAARYPSELAPYRVARLRTPAGVTAFLSAVGAP